VQRGGRSQCFADGDARLPVDAAGSLVVMAAARSVLVFDVSSPEAPALRGWVDVDDPIGALRIVGARVYVVGEGAEASGLVIDVSSPSAPVVVGEHDVAHWVRGVVFRGDHAYRATPAGVEIAAVER
jgi:hypothetical protein